MMTEKQSISKLYFEETGLEVTGYLLETEGQGKKQDQKRYAK